MENTIQKKIEWTKADVVQIPAVIPAVIVDISEESSHNLFPETNRDPHRVVVITFESAHYGIKGYDTVRLYEGADLTNKTKLGQIINTYESLSVGQEIQITTNEKKFWRIYVEE